MNYPTRTTHRNRPSSLRNIVTRAALAYGTYKVASWAWRKWSGSDNDVDQSATQDDAYLASCQQPTLPSTCDRNASRTRRNFMRRRKRSIRKCHLEAMNALVTFMHSLRQSIESETDYSHETKRLKQIRKKKKEEISIIEQEELWKAIKIKSMTRMISTLYVNTIMHLLLNVQIHVLGGRIFHESQNHEEDQSSARVVCDADADTDDGDYIQGSCKTTKNTHTAVLMQTFNHFFESGVIELLNTVKLTVEKATKEWITINELNDLGKISSHELENAINMVRSIEEDAIVIDFVLPSKQHDELQGELEKSLVDETFDIMESPVFDEAMSDCLQMSFQVLESQLQADLFNGQDAVHLVHLFGTLKKITNNFYEIPPALDGEEQIWWDEQIQFPNIYVQAMDRIDVLKELGDISFN